MQNQRAGSRNLRPMMRSRNDNEIKVICNGNYRLDRIYTRFVCCSFDVFKKEQTLSDRVLSGWLVLFALEFLTCALDYRIYGYSLFPVLFTF